MLDLRLNEVAETYSRDGVVSCRLMSSDAAAQHRVAFEQGEVALGPLHYIDKVHTVMRSPFEIVSDPDVLDVVESMIGPDILLYNSTYIVKEPGAASFVAWHQDLTYWGLSDPDAQVSMWFALAPATVESGCMSMIPGSHTNGRVEHVEDVSDENLLLLGQRMQNVDASAARPYELAPGEASFHHGWTVHASGPNTSTDRRIGLNVQYVAPHNMQVGVPPTATLVRGVDVYGHFGSETPASTDYDPEAVRRWRELDQAMKDSFKTKVDDS